MTDEPHSLRPDPVRQPAASASASADPHPLHPAPAAPRRHPRRRARPQPRRHLQDRRDAAGQRRRGRSRRPHRRRPARAEEAMRDICQHAATRPAGPTSPVRPDGAHRRRQPLAAAAPADRAAEARPERGGRRPGLLAGTHRPAADAGSVRRRPPRAGGGRTTASPPPEAEAPPPPPNPKSRRLPADVRACRMRWMPNLSPRPTAMPALSRPRPPDPCAWRSARRLRFRPPVAGAGARDHRGKDAGIAGARPPGRSGLRREAKRRSAHCRRHRRWPAKGRP